jgi:hypothetical protein
LALKEPFCLAVFVWETCRFARLNTPRKQRMSGCFDGGCPPSFSSVATRAAAAPRARGTATAFSEVRVPRLDPAQKEEGGGIQNAGEMSAPVGRGLR